jgi:hypothetical protein
MLQKSRSLLQTTVLSEVQLVQLKSVALFAQVLDMVRCAVLCAFLVGSLFLVACHPLVAEMHGMMHL